MTTRYADTHEPMDWEASRALDTELIQSHPTLKPDHVLEAWAAEWEGLRRAFDAHLPACRGQERDEWRHPARCSQDHQWCPEGVTLGLRLRRAADASRHLRDRRADREWDRTVGSCTLHTEDQGCVLHGEMCAP